MERATLNMVAGDEKQGRMTCGKNGKQRRKEERIQRYERDQERKKQKEDGQINESNRQKGDKDKLYPFKKSYHNQEAGHQADWAGGLGQLNCLHSAAGAVNCAAVLMNVVLMQTSDFLYHLDDCHHSEVHLEPSYCAAVHDVLCCKYKLNN
jgi:hypothetical protein